MPTIADKLKTLYDNMVVAINTTNEFTEALPDCYDAVEAKGGTLPQEQTAGNLADAIESIPSAGGGYPLSAIMSDGTAYIKLPNISNMAELGAANPHFVARITKAADASTTSTMPDYSLIRSNRTSDNFHRAGIFSRWYDQNGHDNIIGCCCTQGASASSWLFSTDYDNKYKKLDCYIERVSSGRWNGYVRVYGSEQEYLQSSTFFNYGFENNQDEIQFVAGGGIWLYSLTLNNEEYIPYFNGTECGLLNTTTNVFYGNSNTAGKMIGIIEP